MDDPETKQAMEKDSLKILKRMAFPNMDKVEGGGGNLPKLMTCISTRLLVLEGTKGLLQDYVQKQQEQLQQDPAAATTKGGSLKTMVSKLGCTLYTCTLCNAHRWPCSGCLLQDGRTPLSEL